MSKIKICELCNKEFDYQCGEFSNHLKSEHKITREQYIVLTEYNGINPKCQCGYCKDDAKFIKRKNEFHKINLEHKKFDWIEKQYVFKFGEPKCETCGDLVNFKRGVPNRYCSIKCRPGTWNQDKVRKTVKDRYGVDNVMDVKNVKNKHKKSIIKTWKNNKKSIIKKVKKTKLDRYGNENYTNEVKKKETCIKNYGVDSFSKTDEFRVDSSDRMIEKNPMKNPKNREKVSKTLFNNLESGKTKLYNTKKYENTDLYYQGSYEKRFLDYCNKKSILNQLKNPKTFKYLKEDRFAGIRHLPDFQFGDDYIIEIKSTYIMNLQGGEKVIEAKRRAVEASGIKYLLILDNCFDKFDKLLDIY